MEGGRDLTFLHEETQQEGICKPEDTLSQTHVATLSSNVSCSLHHIVYKVPITSHRVITHELSKTESSKIPKAQDCRYNSQFMVGNKRPTLLSKMMSQKDLPSVRKKKCNLNKNSKN